VAEILVGAGRSSPSDASGVPVAQWVEHVRSQHLSVGTYWLPPGAVDDQEPHTEDEVYVVTSGRARFTVATGAEPVSEDEVGPGSVIYVAAGEVHAFADPSDDFTTLVVFAPPESVDGGPQPG
jgi:quercetin dioxygenase-like cupin family protein